MLGGFEKFIHYYRSHSQNHGCIIAGLLAFLSIFLGTNLIQQLDDVIEDMEEVVENVFEEGGEIVEDVSDDFLGGCVDFLSAVSTVLVFL